MYVPLVLVFTPFYALHEICGFIISVEVKLIALLTTEILCAINVLVRSYLLLLHPLRKLTSGMTNFMSNPPSDILVIRAGFLTVSTRIASSWKVFQKSLPILTNCAIRAKLTGNIYNKKSAFAW